MLGLAITGGEGPGPDFCRFLAKNANFVIAADSGLLAAEKAGIKPDWIIGDMDSLNDSGDGIKRLEKYPAESVIRFPVDKDFTDTELALDFLWKKGALEIWIAGGGGGRLDHLLAMRSLFERDRFPSRWVTAFEDVRCLDAGYSLGDTNAGEKNSTPVTANELVFECPVDTLISVFPLGDKKARAISTGLKWPLNDLNWDRGSFGISNRTTEETFTVRVTDGRFLIIVPL